MNKSNRQNYGFTFIELIITLAIMSVLLLIAVPLTQVSIQQQKESELRESLSQIRIALDRYKSMADQGRILVKLGESGYPKSLRDLVEGVSDQTSPAKQKLYFLRSLPRDPMATDMSIPAENTWGLRSYLSPPDNPAEGEDVFDIYSKSDKIGLNGVAYRKW
jgi:general secretion pathway protein G